jgi:SAM-dependent methyltransferase
MSDARRLAFGSVAELYDRSRPSYPSALVDDVLGLVGGAPRALEVGAGTGKATVLFAARGAPVLAIEPDAEMAAVWRRNCARFADMTIVETEFERWDAAGARFELVISAQAWHWLTPEVRAVKARSVLADGGALALFWNRPLWKECALGERLSAAYAATVPDFGPKPGPMHTAYVGPPDLWGDYARELDRARGYADAEQSEYRWTRDYSAAEYVALIGTHSDHIVLDEGSRYALLAAVAEAIDTAGGTLTVPYSTHLSTARAA